MRTFCYIILIICLLVGIASAYPNQPLGWQGWSWGTELSVVSGWLNFDSSFKDDSSKIVIDIFNRQGETKSYFGTRWNMVGYGFIDKRLEGVSLVAQGEVNSLAALISLHMQYGEAPTSIELKNGSIFSWWNGDYGNVFAIYLPKGDGNDAATWTFIGTMKFMDAVAASFLRYYPTMAETLALISVTKLLENTTP